MDWDNNWVPPIIVIAVVFACVVILWRGAFPPEQTVRERGYKHKPALVEKFLKRGVRP